MPESRPVVAGIDFGTSNSAVAIASDPASAPTFAEFPLLGRPTRSYRSLLFFDPDEQEPACPPDYFAGTEGIAAYLDALGDGRLIQSFKTHLTTAALGRTRIGPHALGLDDLLTLFLRRLRERASRGLGVSIDTAVVGRPVRFAGSSGTEDDQRAQDRLVEAAREAGIANLHVELEPVAAAYHYESRLDRDELALIADFGGGTSDFCLMRIGPSHRERRDRSDDILATGGVGIAGDDLDAALLYNLVAPALGRGTYYREYGRRMQIPASYYTKLCHWHQLSFLRSSTTRSELERLRKLSEEPDAIDALITIIEDNQGFHLHESIEATKIGLSAEPRARFRFEHEDFELEAEVEREDFETWIAESVAGIAACIDDTLSRGNIAATAVDRVFMTGGTAFVPAVRREFEARFGPSKLSSGDELLSIASGLAARGARMVD